MLMEQQMVTNSAVIHGLCAMTLNQQCIAHSGSSRRSSDQYSRVYLWYFPSLRATKGKYVLSPGIYDSSKQTLSLGYALGYLPP